MFISCYMYSATTYRSHMYVRLADLHDYYYVFFSLQNKILTWIKHVTWKIRNEDNISIVAIEINVSFNVVKFFPPVRELRKQRHHPICLLERAPVRPQQVDFGIVQSVNQHFLLFLLGRQISFLWIQHFDKKDRTESPHHQQCTECIIHKMNFRCQKFLLWNPYSIVYSALFIKQAHACTYIPLLEPVIEGAPGVDVQLNVAQVERLQSLLYARGILFDHVAVRNPASVATCPRLQIHVSDAVLHARILRKWYLNCTCTVEYCSISKMRQQCAQKYLHCM